LQKENDMRIADIMSRPAATCRPDESTQEAARLMWECDCGAVPVVQDDGTIAGIVTDRDICMAAYTRGERLRDIRVVDAMSRVVFTVHPDTPLEEAEQLMANKQIRRLPIVDGQNRPIGIVSLGDVVRHVMGRADGGRGAKGDHAARTLAEISRPRPSGHAPAPGI
jgi:CBS domain-containing protein